jgi:hypothetical protein
MKARKRKNKERVWYLAIIAILILVIIILIIRTYSQFETLKLHREYFRQQHPSIQPWMTVHTIVRNYNITGESLRRSLNANSTIKIDTLTIQQICTKNHLNCTDEVNKINRLIS